MTEVNEHHKNGAVKKHSALLRRQRLLSPAIALLVFVLPFPILARSGLAEQRTATAANNPNKRFEEILLGDSSKSISQLPLYAGLRSGFFDQEGLVIKNISMRGELMAAAFASGDLDYSGITGSMSRFAATGGPVKVVAVCVMRPPSFLMANRSIKTIQDLKGKSVAVNSIGQLADLSMRAFLKKHGINPQKDIRITSISSNRARSVAVETGAVAAGLFSIPLNAVLKESGLVELGFTGDSIPQQAISGVTVSDQVLRDRPAQVRKFLRAYIRGLQVIRANKVEAAAILAKEFDVQLNVAETALNAFYKITTRNGFVSDAAFDDALEFAKNSANRNASISDVRNFGPLLDVLKELNISTSTP